MSLNWKKSIVNIVALSNTEDGTGTEWIIGISVAQKTQKSGRNRPQHFDGTPYLDFILWYAELGLTNWSCADSDH